MESNSGIKLNRRQRKWNKFGKYLVIAGAAVIVAVSVFFVTRPKVTDKIEDGKTRESSAETTANSSAGQSSESQTDTGSGASLTLSGPIQVETFTSADSFKDAVFVGDIFVNGLDDYGLIDEYYLFQSNFFPSTNAVNYVSDVVAMNPSKVFVMLGTDDANISESISTYDVAENVTKVVSDLKAALPNAQIYAISETPITLEYEEMGEAYYKQKTLDEINKGVADNCKKLGVSYINIADAFKTNGYLNDEYTTDGYHINQEYYPYVLNGIANLIK